MTTQKGLRFKKKSNLKPIKAVQATIFQFASVTTINGISYIFDKCNQTYDRLLWLILVCFCAGSAIHMSHQAWETWKLNPVLTSVGSTALPIRLLECF